MRKFEYIKAFASPFVTPTLKWYFGKVAIGVPYFYPRRWVDNPDRPGHKMAIPKKVGFDFVGLGWKRKWSDTDYRFEYAPVISFVFFKWQVAIKVQAPEEDQYWEAWLYYNYNTKGTKQERVQQCRENFPVTYTVYSLDDKKTVDYYDLILKPEYR